MARKKGIEMEVKSFEKMTLRELKSEQMAFQKAIKTCEKKIQNIETDSIDDFGKFNNQQDVALAQTLLKNAREELSVLQSDLKKIDTLMREKMRPTLDERILEARAEKKPMPKKVFEAAATIPVGRLFATLKNLHGHDDKKSMQELIERLPQKKLQNLQRYAHNECLKMFDTKKRDDASVDIFEKVTTALHESPKQQMGTSPKASKQ